MSDPLISFGLGVNWVSKLSKKFNSIRKSREADLDEINEIMSGDVVEIAKYYVEPNVQEVNPADRHEEDFLVSREKVMHKVDQFIRSRAPAHPGYNQLFILGDAGMGKSSLLTILKVLHISSFWPKEKECVLMKLSPKSIKEITQIKNKGKTILLLDSLDEDSAAFGRIRERVLELLSITKGFYRVVITCRTQFFPNIKLDPMERPGLIQIGGYICPMKYLSLFDDEQVEKYLVKRFPRKFSFVSKNKKYRKEAKVIINKMGALRCRPMLLAYIEDLISSPLLQENSSEYLVYKILINSWLLREEANSKVASEELMKACELLAVEMSLSEAKSIKEKELDRVIENNPSLSHIKKIEIKGRSLLNKNSAGDFRFSHYSFMEFMIAHRTIHDLSWKPKENFRPRWTKLILNFLFDGYYEVYNGDRSIRFNTLNLEGAIFRNRELKKADFSNAKLSNSDFSGAVISDTNFEEIEAVKANFSEATLANTSFAGSNLSHSNFDSSSCSDINFKSCVHFSSSFCKANIDDTDFENCQATGIYALDAVIKNSNLKKARFMNADFRYAKFHGSVIDEKNFDGAIMYGTTPKLNLKV